MNVKLNASEKINKWVKSQRHTLSEIMFYQELTAKYFTSEFMQKNDLLVLYWDMGSGKTLGSLYAAISAIDYAPKEYNKIVILSPKSVQKAFETNLKLLCGKIWQNSTTATNKFNYYFEKLVFVPFNAWNSFQQLTEVLDSFEHKIYIIDEVHLFIKSVLKTNLTPEEETKEEMQFKGNGKRIYDTLRKLRHKKILALTGTPLAKFSFELVPLFNLNGNIFTENYKTFETKYYDREEEKLKANAEEIILKKIDGLVSYVPPVETGVKVSPLKIVLVEMSIPQFRRYIYDYSQELKEAGFANKTNYFGFMFGSVSTFHTKSFQTCLYYNENLDMHDYEEITGIKDKNVNLLNKYSSSSLDNFFNKFFSEYSGEEENYKNSDTEEDFDKTLSDNNSENSDTEEFNEQFVENSDTEEFNDEEDYESFDKTFSDDNSENSDTEDHGNSSTEKIDNQFEHNFKLNYVGEDRHNVKTFHFDNTHCPKILKMFEDSQKFEGIKCFYFRLSQTYGCETMAKYLESKGYSLPQRGEDIFSKKKKRYILFTGEFSDKTRNMFMKLSNDKRNMFGEYIEYVILSPSGQVGITIKNCRYIGIGTCEFALSSLQQILTRVNRLNSHTMLPPNKRTLHQFIYFMKKNEKYFNQHKEILSEIMERTDPLIKYDHPCIEHIIHANSIHDDKPMQAFRELMYRASITEKLMSAPVPPTEYIPF